MAIYLALLVILGLVSWVTYLRPAQVKLDKKINQLNKNTIKSYNMIIVVGITLLLIIISSCRDISVGYDTRNYYEYFTFKEIYPAHRSFEFLYELINYIAVKLNFPFNMVLLMCATITFGSLGFVVYKFSDHPAMVYFFFVALGFFGNTFNAVRQYLALAVFLFSLKHIKNGNFIKYVIYVVVAYFFHSSAIILLPIYFLRNLKLTPKFIIVVLVLMLVGSVLLVPAVRIISTITNFDYYQRYIASGEFVQGISLFNVAYALGMIAVFALFYMLKPLVEGKYSDIRNYNIFLLLFFICVAIRTFGTLCGMFSIINRLNIYFFFAIAFLMPYLFDCLPTVWQKLMLLFTFLLGAVYNYISGAVRGTNGVFPYKLIWGTQIVPSIIFYASIVLISVLIILLGYRIRHFNKFGENK